MADQNSPNHGQFSLFKQRRFLPFFLTQFLGAFNDNVFKNSLVLLLTYGTLINADEKLSLYTNAAALLFILPFFLFSGTAGQIADKYEKSKLIRNIKFFEVLIMILAALAFYLQSVMSLMSVLFFMGAQSSFFGPVKYSIIPQHLKKEELVGGNALVESGTFLAILLGAILAGLLHRFDTPALPVSIAVIVFATLGYCTSRAIPTAPAVAPDLKINWNILTQTVKTISFTRRNPTVFIAIMAISWFWFLGAAYLTQFPEYSKVLLSGDDSIVILLLTTFSIGIGVGSLLCEKLSGHKVELGLVPIGSIGLSIFGLDLSLQAMPPATDTLRSMADFLSIPNSTHILLDMLCIGLFGGLYIVPLYTMIQERSDPAVRSRVIAGNNIFNALFMVTSAATGFILLGIFQLSIPEFFFAISILNIAVAVWIFRQSPEFTMRFIILLLTHTLYRVRHSGIHQIPATGPAIVICHQTRYWDTLLISRILRRPVRFVIPETTYQLPILNFILRTGKAIPIASPTSTQESNKTLLNCVTAELKNSGLICLYLKNNSELEKQDQKIIDQLKPIIEQHSIPFIPLTLDYQKKRLKFFSTVRCIVSQTTNQ